MRDVHWKRVSLTYDPEQKGRAWKIVHVSTGIRCLIWLENSKRHTGWDHCWTILVLPGPSWATMALHGWRFNTRREVFGVFREQVAEAAAKRFAEAS